MKKILLTFLVALYLLSTAVTVDAAADLSMEKGIAVVIVGNSDYKTKDFTNIIKDYLKSPSEISILTGNKIQSKYQTYWLDKGLLDEGTPTKEDFVSFVKYGNYYKAIFLVVKDSVSESHEEQLTQRLRTSVTVNAFLVNRAGIEMTASSTNEDDSKVSALRTKRGAFKKCVRELSKEINPELK